MNTRAALALTLACVLASPGAVAGTVNPQTAGETTVEQRGQPGVSALQGPPVTDATVTDIRVRQNGSAVYSLTIRMELGSDEAEAEFDAFAADFRGNRSSYLGDFRDRLTGVVETAQAVTGREMRATGFDAEVGTETVPREWGFVTYRFRWNGFAAVAADTVAVGDVFEDDLFLEETDILVLRGPTAHETTAVAPTPDRRDEGVLRWEGPVTFGTDRPTAEFVRSDDITDDANDDPGGDRPVVPAVLGIGTAVLVGAGALYVHRRRETGAGDETTGDTGATDDTAMPHNLTTDEDRVRAALADAGGRMRQSDLAEQLDWSPSKTSRVLSEMADEGQIEKLRIGRENVIDLVGDG